MTARLHIAVNERDHAIGPADAPVTIVEYGDYACSDCRAALAILRDIQRAYGNNVRVIFRHFPLQKAHPHAFLAAVGAEAAAQQGRFWEYHDRLFARQPDLNRNDLIAYAIAIGLDREAFESALDDPDLAESVTADFKGGVRSDVNSTPTLYLNESRYDGLHTFAALATAIESTLSG